MAKAFTALGDHHRRFIEAQPVFFVATAPSGDEDHVNLSPKGYDTFAVLGPNEVAYLDLTGSGAETAAHLRQNGRITFLFCSFDEAPLLLRVYGRGTVHQPGDAGYDELVDRFPRRRGSRAIVRVAVDRVSTSCGYSVPRMAFVEERARLDEWTAGRTDDDLAAYRSEKNAHSIDGLPALG